MKSVLKYVLIGIFVLSITLNILIFSYFLPRYEIGDFYSKFIERSLPTKIVYEPPTMPEFYLENKLQLSIDKHVQNKEDFDIWKNNVLTKLQDHLGFKTEDITISSVKKLEEDETVNSSLSKYSMEGQDGDQIIFYQLLPNNQEGKIPVVLIIPGSGNQGALDVINKPGEFSYYYYQKGIANNIVDSGFAVFVIENRGWGERSIPTGSLCQGVIADRLYCSGILLSNQLSHFGLSLNSLQVMDTIQLLKYIKSLEHIDSENISIMGLSLGSFIAMKVSALDPEVKSTIMASGFRSYQHRWSGNGAGMLEFFDIPDIVSTIAPRSIYLSWGTNELHPWNYEADTLHSINMIRKAYSLFDAEDFITLVIHEDEFNSGHTYDIPSVLEFLEKSHANT